MDSVHAVLKAHALDVGDVLIFKIGRLGGITKLKQVLETFSLISNTDESIRNPLNQTKSDSEDSMGNLNVLNLILQARDLAVSLDKSIRIDGYAATEIENAALAHIAAR